MEQSKFEYLLEIAGAIQEINAANREYERANWWTGFQRGISRLFYGEKFGTDEEHEKWMNGVYGKYRKQLQDGYRTGFDYHGQRLEV